MRQAARFIGTALLGGAVVLLPVYLFVLLLLKAMQSTGRVVSPLAKLLPEWLPAEQALSLLLVLLVCFLVGIAVRTTTGRGFRERTEKTLCDRLPGYALFRGLTHQMAGTREEHMWKPAMAEIEDALVPAFIIENVDDGRFTVFVPSAPAPFSGSIYVLSAERVHPLDVSFTHAVKVLSQWGCGSRELVAAMDKQNRPRVDGPALEPRRPFQF